MANKSKLEYEAQFITPKKKPERVEIAPNVYFTPKTQLDFKSCNRKIKPTGKVKVIKL